MCQGNALYRQIRFHISAKSAWCATYDKQAPRGRLLRKIVSSREGHSFRLLEVGYTTSELKAPAGLQSFPPHPRHTPPQAPHAWLLAKFDKRSLSRKGAPSPPHRGSAVHNTLTSRGTAAIFWQHSAKSSTPIFLESWNSILILSLSLCRSTGL